MAAGLSPAATPDCLDDDTIAALAEGTLDGAARAAVMPHLATCRRCRTAVASVARALADPAVSREVAAVDTNRRRRLWQIVLPVAAAAIFIAIAWPRLAEDGGHRGPPIPVAPTLLSPIGAVAEASTLRWAGLTGADRYRVTMFDARGRVLYETQISDTTAALPDSIPLTPGRPYFWQVAARIGWDRWSASQLAEFSIARGPPR